MIKINLLPGYIAERKRIKMAWIASGALMALVLIALIGLWIRLQKEVSEWDQKARDAAAGRAEVEGITAQAASERSKIQPIQNKVTFIEDVNKFINRWPELMQEVRRYTYRKVRYTSMQPAQNTLTLQAVTDSTDSAARYLMNMMLNTSTWSSVSISGVPGDAVTIVEGEGFRTRGSAASTTSRPGGGGMAGGGQGMGMGKGPGMAGMGMQGMGMGKGPGMAGMGGGMPGLGGTPGGIGGGTQAAAGQEGRW